MRPLITYKGPHCLQNSQVLTQSTYTVVYNDVIKTPVAYRCKMIACLCATYFLEMKINIFHFIAEGTSGIKLRMFLFNSTMF